MSFPDLAYYLPQSDTCDHVSLYGQRVAERYDDATLAVLATFPKLAHLELLHHKITRFPHGLRALGHAWIGSAPALTTLEGIEDAVGLRWLELSDLPALDLADALERLTRLPELTFLSLAVDHLRELPAAFARLPSLAELKLDYAPNLDFDQAFATLGRLPTLRALTLGEIVVPASIAALHALRKLTVVAQGTLPEELGQLAALEELHLPKARCKALPASIGRLSRLALLDLTYAKVTELPEELGDCRSLRAIHARSSALKTLPASVGRLAALRELDVYNTKLKKLPRSLGELANLRVLELSADKPLQVPEEVFALSLEKFTGPEEILARMVLRRLPTPDSGEILLSEAERLPEDFGNVIRLQLCLPDHTAPIPQLSRLPCVEQVTIDTGNLGDAFTRLASAPQLWRVAVQGERETLPDSIGELARLTTLAIDSGPPGDSDKPGVLRALPAGLGRLTALKTLELTRHRMTEPPEVIGELFGLEKLTLQVCGLSELPRSVGHLQHLRELKLWGVTELRLPDELARCAALADVTLHAGWGKCQLSNLEVLGRLPSLRKLRLVYIRERQDWTGLLASLAGSALEELDLSESELGALPAEIGGLGRLQYLWLDGANIKELPPELRRCTELRRLNWSRWRLSERGRAELKKQLPPGRWKKLRQDRVDYYERTA